MVPSLPRVPGFSEAVEMSQAQAELLKQLPSTIAELQRAVKGLAELVAATTDTVVSAQRVTARFETVLNEIEDPVRSLRPGIERLAAALDTPAIDRIPETLEAIERTVTPLNDGLQRLRRRIARLTRRGTAEPPGS
jgi:ABC-type transporter Mla subunit MlaD